MDHFSLSHRIETCLDEYKALFGGSENLNFSQDVQIAQEELEKLMKCKELTQSKKSTADEIKSCSLRSSGERLAAYEKHQAEMAMKRKIGGSDLSELSLVDISTQSGTSNRMKSRLEVLAEERDYKRRRQSYKGAKAAASKKSYTEVIRDVIDTQSEMLRSMTSNEKRKIKQEPNH